MDRLKRTKTILDAFQKIKTKKIYLVIIGEFSEDMWPVVEPIIKKDPRIRFLGWKNSEELLE